MWILQLRLPKCSNVTFPCTDVGASSHQHCELLLVYRHFDLLGSKWRHSYRNSQRSTLGVNGPLEREMCWVQRYWLVNLKFHTEAILELRLASPFFPLQDDGVILYSARRYDTPGPIHYMRLLLKDGTLRVSEIHFPSLICCILQPVNTVVSLSWGLYSFIQLELCFRDLVCLDVQVWLRLSKAQGQRLNSRQIFFWPYFKMRSKFWQVADLGQTLIMWDVKTKDTHCDKNQRW